MEERWRCAHPGGMPAMRGGHSGSGGGGERRASTPATPLAAASAATLAFMAFRISVKAVASEILALTLDACSAALNSAEL